MYTLCTLRDILLKFISLLNVNFKIASGAIDVRMKHVLPKIISESQVEFLKGRYIGENTWMFYDIMDYCKI